MARCPDCNKFVGYGEQEPEVQDEKFEYDPNTGFVKFIIEVRRALDCSECSTELKETTFHFEQEVLPPVETGLDVEAFELEVEAENSEKVEGKGRGAKMFYGVAVTATLTNNGQELCKYEEEDFVQASHYDEC